jgi:dipeptide/tripeptide permease
MKTKHPKGLYVLFFTEMWERLAFYSVVNVLLLYATDRETGGLGLSSQIGNEIYGLYIAFIYFTPFLGGMIADRFLGYRKSVLIGGLLMAGGLLTMGLRPEFSFFVIGLIGLIIGNGFFKPNISVMVGNLYQKGDPRRDAGFNIFYMGINIGAFIAGIIGTPIRTNAGWLWIFIVAGLGMFVSLAILLANWRNLDAADRQPERSPEDTSFGEIALKILTPALLAGLAGYWIASTYFPNSPVRPAVVGFLAGMIPVVTFFVRLGVTAKPEEKPGLLSLLPVYVAGGTFFMILHLNGSALTQWVRDSTDREVALVPDVLREDALPSYYLNAPASTPRPDPRTLLVTPEETHARMYGQQRLDERTVSALAAAAPDIRVREFPLQAPKEMPAADSVIFERAAKVYPDGSVSIVEDEDHGQKIHVVKVTEGSTALRRVAFVRTVGDKEIATYVVDEATRAKIYEGFRERFQAEPTLLPPGEFVRVVGPINYQSLNALFVVAFTPLLVAFFMRRTQRGKPISTARKLLYGLLLTTASLLLMSVAGMLSDDGNAKVSSMWIVGFYALVTVGELCLSPMGLSLVTKLTPKRLVGLAMGGWFMATAVGNLMSGFFGGIQGQMSPALFFLVLAGLSGLSALFILALLPRLDAAMKKYGA